MKPPLPILVVAVGLAGIALVLAVPPEGALEAAFLAPVLSLAASRLRPLVAAGAAGPVLPAAIGLAVPGALILGGAILGLARSIPESGGAPAALLLGIILSTGDPRPSRWSLPALPTTARPGARLALLDEAHSVLTLLFALPLIAVLSRLPPAGTVALPGWTAIRDLLVGLAGGALTGVAAALLSGGAAPAARTAIHLAASLAAVAAAGAAGGSIAVAAFASGAIGGGASREDAPRGPRPEDGTEEGSAGGMLAAAAGGGLLVVAFRGRPPADLAAAIPWALALWAASLVLRFLVQFGFGGLKRWRRPAEQPLGWLPVLAWASHPGTAALGLLLLSPVPEPLRTVGILAIAISLLVQGTTAAGVLRRGGISPEGSDPAGRWRLLSAEAVALAAELREVDALRSRQEIDDEAAGALREAIGAARQGLELAREDLLAGSPSFRGTLLARAAREVLLAGRRGVAAARREGEIDGSAAEAIEADLDGRLLRSGEASLEELLGPRPGSPRPRGAAR